MKIRFRYELAFETDTEFKAELMQKFMELSTGLIRQKFYGKTNKIVSRLVGKDYVAKTDTQRVSEGA